MVNDLLLKDLSRDDLHTIFTCQVRKKIQLMGKHLLIFSNSFPQAANNNISVPVSTSVKLDMHCEWTYKRKRRGLLCQIFNILRAIYGEGEKGLLLRGCGLEIRCARLRGRKGEEGIMRFEIQQRLSIVFGVYHGLSHCGFVQLFKSLSFIAYSGLKDI